MNAIIYRYGSICEPDIIQGFKELGISILEYIDEITTKNRPLSSSVQLLSDYLLNNPVDFIFSINFFPFISEVCNIFHLRYICWTVDSPVMELYSTAICNEYNRIFLFDKAQLAEFRPYNPKRIFYLPLAANVHNKTQLFQSSSPKMHTHFSHNVAFVGSLYTEKCPYDRLENLPEYINGYLNAIMASQEKIYGYYFISELLSENIINQFKAHLQSFYQFPGKSYLTDIETVSQLYIGNKISALERVHTFQKLSDYFSIDIYTGSDTSSIPNINNHGFAKSLDEMPLIFHNSKINLNITSKAIRSGIPLRVFDIVSCGGFVLSNYQAELPDLFDCDSEIITYQSTDELVHLCDYYLHHSSERNEIAHNAYQHLCQSHTYELRLMEMLEKSFSI